MKKFNLILLIASVTFLWSCGSSEKHSDSNENEHASHEESGDPENKPKSPKQVVNGEIGDNSIQIDYSSPSKRGRMIFGGLVGFGEVWVTGAHRATSVNFSQNVTIGGTNIKSGKYGLFTIPGKEIWTIIINSNWDQHLAEEYSQTDDIVRIEVTPSMLDEVVESLTYEVEEIDSDNGVISISWDQIQVSFDVKNAS